MLERELFEQYHERPSSRKVPATVLPHSSSTEDLILLTICAVLEDLHSSRSCLSLYRTEHYTKMPSRLRLYDSTGKSSAEKTSTRYTSTAYTSAEYASTSYTSIGKAQHISRPVRAYGYNSAQNDDDFQRHDADHQHRDERGQDRFRQQNGAAAIRYTEPSRA